MIKYLSVFLIITVSITANAGSLSDYKKSELKNLAGVLNIARKRIENAPSLKGSDFLRLLPQIIISRRAPYGDLPNIETYYSISITTSQIFSINDAANKRDEIKRRSMRKVWSMVFRINKLIERKYLYRGMLWKLWRMRGSMENPVEIAKIDEKIDILRVKIEETEIEIEKGFAEIDYACIEAGGDVGG